MKTISAFLRIFKYARKRIIALSIENRKLKARVQILQSAIESEVEQYKSGKEKLFGYFVGEVMKESKGKANPKIVNKILRERLKK